MSRLYPWHQVAGELAAQQIWSEADSISISVGGTSMVVNSKEEAIATLLSEALRTGELAPRDAAGFPIADELSVRMSDVHVTADDVNTWLRGKRFPFFWAPSNGRRNYLKSAEQERVIVGQIRALGHDPAALPKTNGKAGVKKAVKRECLKQRGLYTEGSFDKAWERLRKDGRIGDQS